MYGKRPNRAQPFEAAVFMAARRLCRAGNGQLSGDMICALRFEKCEEYGQPWFVFAQFVSKGLSKFDVVPQIFSEISHRSPPGQG
jgi:hypothetical protein